MYKTKSERCISILLLSYFFILFFYGVIIKYTFTNALLFKLKTYMPEFLLAFVCLNCICKPIKIYRSSLFMIGTITMILLINVLTSFSTSSALMTFRDVFIPLITGFCLCSIEITENEKKYFLKILSKICMIALICGFLLGGYQYLKGWQWTSSWYTGYSFWGKDEKSSLFIMTSGSYVRVPSITGHNVKFGMYSFFQYLVIAFAEEKESQTKKNIKKILFAFIMLTNVYISNNKTTIVIILILVTIWSLNKYAEHTKVILLCFFSIFGAYVYFNVLASSDFMISFYDRFSKWAILKDTQLLRNIIFPVSTYKFAGNSVTESAVLKYWDNTYLYFIFSFGFVGFLSVMNWLRSIYQRKMNDMKYGFEYYLTFFTAFAATTTSIVLGRCFFCIYVIMMAYLATTKRGND